MVDFYTVCGIIVLVFARNSKKNLTSFTRLDWEVKSMKKIIAILLVALFATSLFATASASYFDGNYGLDRGEISEITGPYCDRVILATPWKDGLVATLEGDEVGYFVDGQVVAIWQCPTTDEDFFVDLSKGFPNAEYSLCLVLVTGELYSFRDDISMNIEETGVYLYGFCLDWEDYFAQKGKSLYSYFFLKQDGALYYWSPYAKVLLTNANARDLVVNVDYVFFSDDFGVHVINASLAEMNLHNQRFFSYHPLPIIDLGNVDIWEYCGGLYAIDGDEFYSISEPFDQKYGIDFSIWGTAKTEFTLDDFAYYPSRSFYRLQEILDNPEGEYANPVIYHNVSFYGHDGYLSVRLQSRTEIEQIRWISYDGSFDINTDLEQIIFESGGIYIDSGTYEDEDITADAIYDYNGQLIHVCYYETDTSFETIVYANNMEILNE